MMDRDFVTTNTPWPRMAYRGKSDVPTQVNEVMTQIINLPVYQYLIFKRELDAYIDQFLVDDE